MLPTEHCFKMVWNNSSQNHLEVKQSFPFDWIRRYKILYTRSILLTPEMLHNWSILDVHFSLWRFSSWNFDILPFEDHSFLFLSVPHRNYLHASYLFRVNSKNWVSKNLVQICALTQNPGQSKALCSVVWTLKLETVLGWLEHPCSNQHTSLHFFRFAKVPGEA